MNNNTATCRGSIRFVWTERASRAEIFAAQHPDGSFTEVLSPEEIEAAEQLIAQFATAV